MSSEAVQIIPSSNDPLDLFSCPILCTRHGPSGSIFKGIEVSIFNEDAWNIIAHEPIYGQALKFFFG
jgi:hypothetical protein